MVAPRDKRRRAGRDLQVDVEQLLSFIERAKVPPDAKVWIEYPVRYGLASPSEVLTVPNPDPAGTDDASDFVVPMSLRYDPRENRLYVHHHY